MPHPIRHVFFDLGQVLIRLRYDQVLPVVLPWCEAPWLKGDRGEAFTAWFRTDPMLVRYEKGELDREAYFRHFAARTGYRGDLAQFADHWHALFELNRPMADFLQELAPVYPLYLLSNTADLHVPYVFERFPELDRFTDCALSFELGALKPDPVFYEKALARFGLRAETCLFVDDLEANVRAAEACGIRSIRFTGAEETLPRLRALLLPPPAGCSRPPPDSSRCIADANSDILGG